MKTIEIDTIPHKEQRYDTVGDYQETRGGHLIAFTISKMPDWRSEAAVAVHELVEYFLISRARIKLEVIDKWDLDHADTESPGDVPDCPYAIQHRFAENIERLVVAQLGLTWDQHSENCDAAARLGPGRPTRATGSVRGGGPGVLKGADRSLPAEAGGGSPVGAPGQAQTGSGNGQGHGVAVRDPVPGEV